MNLASGTGRALEEIPILISCGGEMDDLRKIAADVLDRLNHLLRFERGSRYWFTQWNYKHDSSRDEELGHEADRSVNAVGECEGVIAIVGDGVPPTTRLEIRHVYELRKLGQDRELWVLARKAGGHVRDGDIPLTDFVAEIERDFSKHRIYHPVEDALDFQASLLIELFPFVVSRTGDAFGRLGGVSA